MASITVPHFCTFVVVNIKISLNEWKKITNQQIKREMFITGTNGFCSSVKGGILRQSRGYKGTS